MIYAQKPGVKFNFADNQRLKESGFAIDGVTVNGYVNQDGITINVNSAKALNRVVGHEITHILEGTDLYDSLAMAVATYAKTKGEYESRLQQIRELYKGKEGYTGEEGANTRFQAELNAEAKLEKELIADLVGDYIFTDKAFVEKLFQEEPGLFKRIFEEIKYLCKLVTAGSKEARQLEKSKKMFENAVSEAKQDGVKNPTAEGGVKYSVQNNVVDVNGKIYAKVVKPGLTVYQSVKHNKKNYISYLHKKIFNRKITVLDYSGEQVVVEFAGDKERIKKEGSKHPRRALGELEETSDRLKMIAIINIKDLLKNSTPLTPKEQHLHQWLDEGGWKDRIAYMQDFDVIYPVVLHIAKTDDGRHLEYDVSVLKDEGASIDIDATARTTSDVRAPATTENGAQSAVELLVPSSEKISQQKEEVKKNSLSAPGQGEAAGGGWDVRGQDVGLPMPEGYQESQVAVTENQQAQPVNLPGLKKSQPQSQGKAQEAGLPMPKQSQGKEQKVNLPGLENRDEKSTKATKKATLPMPERTVQQEQQDLDAEYRRQMGDDSSYYDPAEGEEIETARERLEVQRSNLQIELRENQRLRQEMIEDFDQKIEAKQAQYDGKKLKHSKTAQALLRDIEKLKRKKADRMAEYDQAIAQIERRHSQRHLPKS